MNEAMCITAYLQTGIVCDPWMPLDGTLYYAASMERDGCFDQLKPAASNDLPIATYGEGDDWYFAISFASPQPWWLSEGTSHQGKGFDEQHSDLIDFQGRRGMVQTNGGPYKTTYLPVFYRVATHIQWFANGDITEVRRLVQRIRFLGKHNARGWGAVLRWDVQPIADDWSVFGPNGMLMRAIPMGERALSQRRGRYAIRPPYYLPQHMREVWLP